jgi:hypothetical protein
VVAGGDGERVPGYCADHPNQRLVTHRAAGIQWWHAPVETICPSPDHSLDERERCRYCGGRLYPAGTPLWSMSVRRTFCSDADRLRAFRAKRGQE